MKKKTINNIYNKLQKNRTAIKIRAFLMAGLMLAINTFAWFTYISNADNNINVDVIKWDIEFFEEDTETSMMNIDLDNLYPGMTDFVKGITIRNSSDLGATFSYKIDDIMIFGEKYESADMINSLKNDFPFYITFDASATEVPKGGSISFKASVGWKYEKAEKYCLVKDYYPYSSVWDYYDLVDGKYELTTYDADSYSSKTKDTYVECDDLDSYWGEKNAQYKKDHPDSSALTLKLKLMVTQKEA